MAKIDFSMTALTILFMLFYGFLAIILQRVRFDLIIFGSVIGIVFLIEIFATIIQVVLE